MTTTTEPRTAAEVAALLNVYAAREGVTLDAFAAGPTVVAEPADLLALVERLLARGERRKAERRAQYGAAPSGGYRFPSLPPTDHTLRSTT